MDKTGSGLALSNKRSRSEVEAEDGDAQAKNGVAEQDGMYAPRWNHNRRFSKLTRDGSDSSSDDEMGPQLPSTAPKKKRRVLRHEKLYLSSLPSSPRYAKSLMHKEQLSFVTMTPFTDFLITSSVDGVVKFWKKVIDGVEFVKEFKAHVGEITSVSISADGRSFATAGVDKTLKIFDVVTFGSRALFIVLLLWPSD